MRQYHEGVHDSGNDRGVGASADGELKVEEEDKSESAVASRRLKLLEQSEVNGGMAGAELIPTVVVEREAVATQVGAIAANLEYFQVENNSKEDVYV